VAHSGLVPRVITSLSIRVVAPVIAAIMALARVGDGVGFQLRVVPGEVFTYQVGVAAVYAEDRATHTAALHGILSYRVAHASLPGATTIGVELTELTASGDGLPVDVRFAEGARATVHIDENGGIDDLEQLAIEGYPALLSTTDFPPFFLPLPVELSVGQRFATPLPGSEMVVERITADSERSTAVLSMTVLDSRNRMTGRAQYSIDLETGWPTLIQSNACIGPRAVNSVDDADDCELMLQTDYALVEHHRVGK